MRARTSAWGRFKDGSGSILRPAIHVNGLNLAVWRNEGGCGKRLAILVGSEPVGIAETHVVEGHLLQAQALAGQNAFLPAGSTVKLSATDLNNLMQDLDIDVIALTELLVPRGHRVDQYQRQQDQR